MKLEGFLILAYLFSLALWVVLFFIFNFTTIRRLRKSVATKETMKLYYGYVVGFDYPSISVAFRFALPRQWLKRILLLPSDIDILYQNTSPFDRLLGIVIIWLMIVDMMIFIAAFVFVSYH